LSAENRDIKDSFKVARETRTLSDKSQALAVECLKWREIAKNEKNP